VFLDLGEQAVLLFEREIAAAVHDDLAVIGLDVREEFDAAAEFSIGDLHRDQEERRQRQRASGVAQRKADGSHIGPAILRALVVRNGRGLAEQRAERRGKEQRDHERCGQRRNKGDRQILHELADYSRPEQERREGSDAGRGRGDHRPRHALGCERIGRAWRHAFGHSALGKFGNDDGVVDQHADG
jgi:hypothetical protein